MAQLAHFRHQSHFLFANSDLPTFTHFVLGLCILTLENAGMSYRSKMCKKSSLVPLPSIKTVDRHMDLE